MKNIVIIVEIKLDCINNVLESENSWNRKHNFRKLPKFITEINI